MDKKDLIGLAIGYEILKEQGKLNKKLEEIHNPKKSKHISEREFWENSRKWHREQKIIIFLSFCGLVLMMRLADWS